MPSRPPPLITHTTHTHTPLIQVPEDVEKRILDSESPVKESMTILQELLATILEQTATSGVPLGVNVESLSIFKEEIDAGMFGGVKDMREL